MKTGFIDIAFVVLPLAIGIIAFIDRYEFFGGVFMVLMAYNIKTILSNRVASNREQMMDDFVDEYHLTATWDNYKRNYKKK